MPIEPGSADLGDRRGRRPGDRVVAAEDDRDRPGRGDLADLAVDEGVGPVDPGRARCSRRRRRRRRGSRTARRRAAASGSSPRCTGPRGSPAARTGRPDRWLTASSKGAPTIATSGRAAGQLGRVRDPGQLHERGRADVGRQVEVAEDLVRRDPSRCEPRSRGSAVGSGSWRSDIEVLRDGRAAPGGPAGRDRLLGAPPVRIRRPAGRAGPIVASAPRPATWPAGPGRQAPGRPPGSPRNSRQAASTRAGSANSS